MGSGCLVTGVLSSDEARCFWGEIELEAFVITVAKSSECHPIYWVAER